MRSTTPLSIFSSNFFSTCPPCCLSSHARARRPQIFVVLPLLCAVTLVTLLLASPAPLLYPRSPFFSLSTPTSSPLPLPRLLMTLRAQRPSGHSAARVSRRGSPLH